jgi:hypothetical protein
MGLFNIFKKKDIDYTKVKIKLKKVFETEPNYTNFGQDPMYGEGLGIYSENDFDEIQLGYRVDSNGFKNKRWLGNQYFVVGGYGGLGDSLVVDASDDSFPIYALEHDNWDNFEKISNSFEDFVKIISLIENVDFNNKDQCEKLKLDISKITKSKFWNTQIYIASN